MTNTLTATCKKSGAIASAKVLKAAIYTDRGWLGFCPGCGHAAPIVMAEVKPTNDGYRRRYSSH